MGEETKIVELIKAIAAVEDEIRPYKEHIKDLKKNYVENGWLTKEQVQLAMKAYSLIKSLKSDKAFDELGAIYDSLMVGGVRGE